MSASFRRRLIRSSRPAPKTSSFAALWLFALVALVPMAVPAVVMAMSNPGESYVRPAGAFPMMTSSSSSPRMTLRNGSGDAMRLPAAGQFTPGTTVAAKPAAPVLARTEMPAMHGVVNAAVADDVEDLSGTQAVAVPSYNWSQVTSSTNPGNYFGAGMAYDAAIGKIVLFGGQSSSGYNNVTWTFDGNQWKSVTTAHVPNPVVDPAMAYDPISQQVVLFGGVGPSGVSADTWTFNGTDWTKQTYTVYPSARDEAGMAYSSVSGALILFGGETPTLQQDTWMWTSGGGWVLKQPASGVTPPSARRRPKLAYDSTHGSLLMFGGLDEYSSGINDVWLWDSIHWVSVTAARPAQYVTALALVDDPAMGGLVWYGESTTGSPVATWFWNGTAWSNLTTATVLPDYADVAGAYLPQTQSVVLASGLPFSGGGNGDAKTWALRSSTAFSNVAVRSSVTSTVTFSFTSGGSIDVPAVLTDGQPLLDYTDAGTGSCNTNGTTHSYNVGDTCTVDVTFSPKYAGMRTGAIQLVDSTGNLVGTALLQGIGSGPQVTFRTSAPTAVQVASGLGAYVALTVDRAGNVFIADNSNGQVLKVPYSGGVYGTAIPLGSGWGHPSSIAVDGAGSVIVSDTGSGALKTIPLINGVYGTPVTNTVNALTDVTMDGSGNLFALDTSHRLLKIPYSQSGYSTASVIASGFSGLSTVALDEMSNLYISDATGQTVQKLSYSAGAYGTPTNIGSGVGSPYGLAVDAAGNIYEAAGQGIRMIPFNGGAYGPAVTLSSVSLAQPSLALDSAGNLYYNTSDGSVWKLAYDSAPSLTFPNTGVGFTSATKTVTLANIGDQPLSISVPGTGTNPSLSANFSRDGSSTCPQVNAGTSAGALASAATCTEVLAFAPTASGSVSGSQTFTDNHLNGNAAVQSITLSGTGMDAPTVTSVSPNSTMTGISIPVVLTGSGFTGATSVSFGTVAATSFHVDSDTQITAVTRANTPGTVDVFVTTPYGTNAASSADHFTYILPAAFTTLGLSATPPGGVQGQSVALTATLSPYTNSGYSSDGQSITFYNNDTTLIGTATLSGGVATLNISTLPVGDNSINAIYSGDVNFNTSTSPYIHVVVTAPTSFAAPTTAVGATGSTQTATLVATSNFTVGSYAVLTQGIANQDFTGTAGPECLPGSVMSTGDVCTVQWSFSPKFPGTRNGSIVLYDAAGNPKATVYLSGVGNGAQMQYPKVNSYVPIISGSDIAAAEGVADAYMYGVTVDPANTLYFADFASANVMQAKPSGSSYAVSVLGTLGGNPEDVALDGAGNLYVATNDGVAKYTRNTTGFAPPAFISSISVSARGLAVDGAGTLYIADGGTNVYKETFDGSNYTQSVVASAANGLSGVTGVAVNPVNGDVFLADYGAHAVFKAIASGGAYTVSKLADFDEVYGVKVDAGGAVYAVSQYLGISAFWPGSGGSYTQQSFGALYPDGTYLTNPGGITLDGAGNLYVNDTSSGTVTKLSWGIPPTMDFGSVNEGSNGSQSVSLRNSGNTSLQLSVPSSSNPSVTGAFALASTGTTCPVLTSSSSAATLAAGAATCDYALTYTPTASGAQGGMMTLTDNAPSGVVGVANGTQQITLAGTGVPVPSITSINPTSGSTAGGTSVTINGSHFTGATAVRFGAGAGGSVTVVSDAKITAVTPAGTSGTVDVQVDTPNGTATLTNAFTYVSPTPAVLSVSPNSGSTVGGTSVAITGTNLSGVVAVSFGGTPATSFAVNSDSSVSAVAPAHSAATVDVTVSTSDQTSATNAADRFTYATGTATPGPIVAGLAPAAGSIAGGASVTITGLNFTGATAVKFGTVSATSFIVTSATSITATAPANVAGIANVTVTTSGGGTSAITTGDQFFYAATVYTVNGTGDTNSPSAANCPVGGSNAAGPCTLRDAVTAANAATGSTVINFSPTVFNTAKTITLNSTVFVSPNSYTEAIAGPGQSIVTISGNGTVQNMQQSSGTMMLSGIRLALGGMSAGYGGCLGTNGVATYVNSVTFAYCVAGTNMYGGAWFTNAPAYIDNSTFTSNSSSNAGGAIYQNNPLTVQYSLFSANQGTTGGAINLGDPSSVVIRNSVFASNAATAGGGGAISDDYTAVTVSNSTFYGNTSTTEGAAIIVATGLNLPLTVSQSTFTQNQSFGGFTSILASDGGMAVTNSIISGNTASAVCDPDCNDPSNIYDTGTPTTLFSSLGMYGGILPSLLPLPGSSAIHHDSACTVAQDVRGYSRSATGACDAGAVQTNYAATWTSEPPSSVNTNTSFNAGLTFTEQGNALSLSGPQTMSLPVTLQGNGALTGSPITSLSAAGVASGSFAVDTAGTGDTLTAMGVVSSSFDVIAPTPTVTAVTPHNGSADGGTSVTITGTNLTGASAVTFDGIAATNVVVNSATSISATTPAHAGGLVDVAVTTPGGTATASGAYTYIERPTVTFVSPDAGSTSGGQVVTITGTGFAAITGVSFGSSAGTNIQVNSSTSITVTTPAHSAGMVHVTVTAAIGTSTTTSADEFTYADAPTLTAISPAAGPMAGGTSVTLTGTNLTGATVSIGGAAATNVTVVNATTISATTPAHAAGAVNVVVTTPGGTATLTNGYTYAAAPTLASVSPNAGPVAGSTSVTLSGANLSGASAVTFDGIPATNVVVVNATTITATTPAHAAGAVNVVVTTAGGSASATNAYTYAAAPTIGSISPVVGPIAGDTLITITGTNLTGTSSVLVGGDAATNVIVVNATTVTAHTPAHAAGTVGLVVTTPGGTSTLNNAFTYQAPAATFKVTSNPSATAGTAFTVTVTAYAADGTTVATGYTGTVHLTSNDSAAVLPADTTLTNGIGTFNVTLKTAGSKTVTATDTVTSSIHGVDTVTVNAGAAASFTLTAPPPVTAGTLAVIPIAAFDAYGNAAVGYSGTVHVISSDSTATLSPDFTMSNGAGTFSATLQQPGSVSVTATDTVTASITGTITLSVAAVASDLTYSIGTHTFGDAPFTGTVHSSSSGAITYTVTSGGAFASVNATTGQVTILGAGSVTIHAAQVANGIYAAGSADATFTIDTETPTLAFGMVGTKTYGDAPFTVAATSASSGAVTYSITSGNSFASVNATSGLVTITGVGAVTLRADQAAAGNYASAFITTNFTINAETPALAFSAISSHTVGEPDFVVSAASASTGAVTYSITSGNAFATINPTTGSVHIVAAGSVTVQADQAAAGNYGVATATANFTINAAGAPTITFAGSTHTYGDADFTVVATSPSSGAFTYTVTSGGAFASVNATSGLVHITGAGSVTIHAQQAAAGIYTAAGADANITISPKAPSLSFAAVGTKSVGDADFTASASSESSGAVTYSITSGNAFASINAATGLVHIVGAGSVTLHAVQAATANYATASADVTFSISAGTPTLAFATIATKTVGDPDFTVSATSASSGAVTYSITSGNAFATINATTGLVHIVAAGSVTVRADQASSTNYSAANTSTTFVINPANAPTLAFAISGTHTYGDADFTVAAMSNSPGAITYAITTGSAVATVNATTGLVHITGVGPVTIRASQVAAGTYAAATQDAGFTVNTLTPSLTFAPIATKTVGDADFTVAATSSSSGTVTYSITSGNAFATINASTGSVHLIAAGMVTVRADQATAGNYGVANASTTFTINAATVPSLSFSVGGTHTFGDADFTVAATSNSPGAITYSVISGGASATVSSAGLVHITAVGAITIRASQAASGTYAAATADASFTIQPVAAGLALSIADHAVSDADFALTATSHSSAGITYAITAGNAFASISGNVIHILGAGTVTVTASQAAIGNYAAATVPASFTIRPSTPTLAFTIANHTYGDAPFAVAATSASNGAITYSVVSGPATVAGALVTLTGAGRVTLQASQATSANYNANTAQASFTVGKATPTVTWPTPAPVSYGTAIGAAQLNATATGVGGASLPGTFAYIPVAGVVPQPPSQTLSVVFTPSDATNYTTATAGVTLTIRSAQLTIAANNVSRSYGVVNPAFTGTITGQQNGDIFTEAFSTQAQVLSTVGAYAIVPSATGANLSNYTQVVQNGTLTITKADSITKLALGVVAPVAGQQNSYTATVTSATSGTPTGTVQFADNGVSLGVGTLVNGVATLSAASGAPGTHTYTAIYSGDVNFNANTATTSGSISVVVAPPDFTFTADSATTAIVTPGSTSSFSFHVAPGALGYYYQPVNFTYYADGLPAGAKVSLTPMTLGTNAGAQDVVLTVYMPTSLSTLGTNQHKGTGAVLAFLLLPLTLWRKRKLVTSGRVSRLLSLVVLLALGLSGAAAITGCGGYADGTYPITVTATSGTVSHSVPVTVKIRYTF